MPTYEYACRQCGNHLEVVQKFTDEPLSTCPSCSGSLRKVFGNIGISFKGSGFYKTDSRASDNGGRKAEKETSSSGDSSAKSGDGASSNGSGTSSGSGKTDGPKADAPKAAS